MKKLLTLMLTMLMSITLFSIKAKASSNFVFYVTDDECPDWVNACYTSIQDAVDDMSTDADTYYSLYLDKDVDIANTIVIENKRVSINTHGYKIYNSSSFYSEENNTLSLFSVREGGNLNFYVLAESRDSVDAAMDIVANDCHVVDVQGETAYFGTSTKGNIKSSKAIIYVKQGSATIGGGTFETTSSEYVSETLKSDEQGNISVTGGWFVNYDPSAYIHDWSDYQDVALEGNTYVVGKHTINISAGEKGKISPSGDVVVAGEERIPVVISADNGYAVDEEFKDGELYHAFPSDTNATTSYGDANAKETFYATFRKNSNIRVFVDPETDEKTAELEPTLDAGTSVVESILTDEEKEAFEQGADANVTLSVKEASDEKAIEEAKSLLEDDRTVGILLDISLSLQVGDEEPRPIKETNRPISVEIKLPDSLKNTDPSKSRKYTVIRVHDGVPEVLENCYYNDSTGILTINTDRFSTYMIAYADADRALEDALNVIYYFNGNKYNDESYNAGLSGYIIQDNLTLTEEENKAIKEGKNLILNLKFDDVSDENVINNIKSKLDSKNFISAGSVSAEFGVEGSQLNELSLSKAILNLYFDVPEEYLNEKYEYFVYKYVNGNLIAVNADSTYDSWTDEETGEVHYYAYEDFDGELATYVLAYTTHAESPSNNNGATTATRTEANTPCEEWNHSKNWTWSESQGKCVYRVSNTNTK